MEKTMHSAAADIHSNLSTIIKKNERKLFQS